MWSIRDGAVTARRLQPRQNPVGLVWPRRVGGTRRGSGCAGVPVVQVVGERLDALVPQRAGLLHELARTTGIVQPDIGDRTTLILGGLGVDARPRVGLAEPAVFDEAPHARFDVGMDNHHQRKHRRHLRFHQQRDVLDDHRVSLVVARTFDQLRTPMRHKRMHDAVQRGALLVVTERDRGQRRPVQRAVRAAGCPSPNASTSFANPSVPGSTTSRAMTSPSTTIAPRSLNVADTVDLPAPIPPVNPIRNTAPVCQAGPGQPRTPVSSIVGCGSSVSARVEPVPRSIATSRRCCGSLT